MKCIFLLPCFLATTLAIKSKSVNFALQTSFLFDPKTANQDISLITNLRRFLGKLESYISSPRKFLRANDEPKNLLTGFLRNFAEVIINYEGDDVHEFAKALDGEMEEYYYTGTIFHQIVFDPKLKTFLRNSIKEWAITDPDELKYQLEFYLNSTNTEFDNFIRVLDSFYGEKDEEQLNNIISDITKPKPLVELSEIIKEALKFIIFDRYEKLNYTSKAILAEEIGKLTEYVAENYESKIKDAETVFTYKRNLKNDTFSKNFLNKNTTVNSANATPQKPSKVVKEIVLNKNIEIDVRRSDIDSEKKESEATTGAATIIFRSEDNPSVTNIVNLADLLWEHGSSSPDVETLNFKLKL